jgi:heptosyltransferase-1
MRILFVKTSSLGDVIHHCPAVTDVRRLFPNGIFDWIVEESFADIAQLHPAVRRVIPIAMRRWRTRIHDPSVWTEIAAFRRAVRSEQYDLVIDTQGLLKSALVTTMTRGSRHGYDSASAREPIASRFYDVVHDVAKDMHAVERNRALTAAACNSPSGGSCDYGLVPRPPLSSPWRTPYCFLLTMTSRADKLWPEERWAQVALSLKALGLESVFPWGAAHERDRCERIVRLAGSGAIAHSMRIDEIASAMTLAKMVIGVDTGLTHLAAALKVPAIGIYGGSEPVLTGLHGAGKLINVGGAGQVPTVSEIFNAIETVA